VIETETMLIDQESREAYSRYVQSSFYVKQGNWGGPKGPSTPTYPPPKGREETPDKVLTTRTTGETSLLYRLNGDYNPLHASPEIGQKMGFGGTILHGLYSFNRAMYGLVKEFCGGDSSNIREIQARFAVPVRPGETTITKMWRMGTVENGWEEIRFAAYVEGGKAVLTNGKAIVRCVSGSENFGKL
jgi:peroxisomal enoyl-CoA hydratase 2